MSMMVTSALTLLACAGLAFVAALLADGTRVLLGRRRHEAAARPLMLVVTERHESAGQLLRLTLARADGSHLPAFAAGQYVQLQLPAGQNGRVLRRAYSLAAWSVAPHHYELGIKREENGLASSWIWQHLQVGHPVSVLPPKGDFVLAAHSNGPLVLVGGGIGITPMRAMLHAALAAGDRKAIMLFHGARSAAELLYLDEFQSLAEIHPHFRYYPFVSRPDISWGGASGRLDGTRIAAALDRQMPAAVYLCAGNAMMDKLRQGLVAAGIDGRRIHQESFGITATGSTTGQRIAFEQDGTTREIVTAGEPTLLATLEAHGLAPAAECRSGTCGECRTRLVEGEVRWLATREIALPEDQFLPCICAASGNLRLTPV